MQIVSLDKSILESAREILAAETGWSEITRRAANSQETRTALEAELFHAPSAETLDALVSFDNAQRTLGDLQHRIVAGQLNPAKFIGARVKALLTAPLAKAIGELELELAESVREDERLAIEHGMASTPGPRSRAISERLQVAQNTLVQVGDGSANPGKIFAKLGHGLTDAIDAESMSQAALRAVRDTQHILAKSA